MTNEQLAVLLDSYSTQIEAILNEFRDEIRMLDKESGDILPERWRFGDQINVIGQSTKRTADPEVLKPLKHFWLHTKSHAMILAGEHRD